MATAALNLQVSPDILPALQRHNNLEAEKIPAGGHLIRASGCCGDFWRFFVPGSGTRRDLEVLSLFQERIKQPGAEPDLIHAAAEVAREFAVKYPCESYKPALSTSEPSQIAAWLERHTLNDLENPHYENPANLSVLEKWKQRGLPEELFYQHPEFVDFILSNNLHNVIHYYAKHNPNLHQVGINEPCILLNGQLRPWSEVSQELQLDAEGKLQGWFYSETEGLIEYDVNGWQQFSNAQPLFTLPFDERPLQPQFSIVTAIKKYPQGALKGEHSSFRITLTTGEVYSFGLWSDPVLETGGVKTACATGTGQFVCPDMFELMGEDSVELVITDFAMTEQQLQQMIARIDQLKAEGIPFQWWSSNCSVFVTDFLQIIDIQLNTTQTLFDFMPQKVQDVANAVWNHLPWFVRGFLKVVALVARVIKNIFINGIFVLFMGAAKGVTKRQMTEQGQEVNVKYAMISSAKDFFFKGMECQLPGRLLQLQRHIEQVRNEEFTVLK